MSRRHRCGNVSRTSRTLHHQPTLARTTGRLSGQQVIGVEDVDGDAVPLATVPLGPVGNSDGSGLAVLERARPERVRDRWAGPPGRRSGLAPAAGRRAGRPLRCGTRRRVDAGAALGGGDRGRRCGRVALPHRLAVRSVGDGRADRRRGLRHGRRRRLTRSAVGAGGGARVGRARHRHRPVWSRDRGGGARAGARRDHEGADPS